jgi:hypothetical protein
MGLKRGWPMAGLFRHVARTANFLGLSALAVTRDVGAVALDFQADTAISGNARERKGRELL